MANEIPSTENLVVSPPPARSLVVLERVTATTTPLLAEERPGRDTTPSASGDTDKRLALEVDACALRSNFYDYTMSLQSSKHSICGGDGAVAQAVYAAVQRLAALFSRQPGSCVMMRF